ncbi:hypothetical protein CYMTET_43557 [Cymbomonas tetramitiformis]|uniref:HAT C-terminal dimerisation domain-containing protein n=1 Tax=Cymbomonas tetramitiformis TaxID=36881 RepID=A0AAE0C1Y7_9CHLO|nr:hypothetical protein CYMTET_43557 [Cymbomonas tetramitiformis]
MSRNSDLLGWWKVHSKDFPTLGRTARQFLVVPATTADVERAFSKLEQEKPMRLPALKDTTRLTELLANVAEQQEQREDFKDIHDDEWCLEWLKSRGTVEPPAENDGNRQGG